MFDEGGVSWHHTPPSSLPPKAYSVYTYPRNKLFPPKNCIGGCRGGSRYVEGCWGFHYLICFVGFLVVGFLVSRCSVSWLSVSWFLDCLVLKFSCFMVPKFLGFKVSDILIPYPRCSRKSYKDRRDFSAPACCQLFKIEDLKTSRCIQHIC